MDSLYNCLIPEGCSACAKLPFCYSIKNNEIENAEWKPSSIIKNVGTETQDTENTLVLKTQMQPRGLTLEDLILYT